MTKMSEIVTTNRFYCVARGWNYCVVHKQYYSGHQISISPTLTAIEPSEPIQQAPFVAFVGQDGTVCEKLF